MTVSSSVNFYIGSMLLGQNTYAHFVGAIDELSYFPRVFSESQIKELFNSNSVCDVTGNTTVPVEEKVAKCGDGVVDALNDKGVREECDDGSENGKVCSNGYNKSCTYCSADCSAVITREANGYCGDGVINGSEVCETSGDIIYSANSTFGKTDPAKSSQNNGYRVYGCAEEKNFRLNGYTIASTSNWNALLLQWPNKSDDMINIWNALKTVKKGAKKCGNNCLLLEDNCTECGLTSKDKGSVITGKIFNVLEPNTVVTSNFRSPLLQTQKLELFFNYDITHENNLRDYGVAYKTSVGNSFALSAVGPTANENAYVNTNPSCSILGENEVSGKKYYLAVNGDYSNNRLVDIEVLSGASVSQYDLVLSPIIRKSNYSSSRPKDIRVVIRWLGGQEVFGGFMAGASFLEGLSFDGEAVGVNYYTNSAKKGIWYHGLSTPLVGGGTQVESFTIDTGVMVDSLYAFYIKAPEGRSINSYSTSDLRVEIYIPEDSNDGDWGRFGKLVKTFRLQDAVQSDNKNARYWHVFNVVKNSTANPSNLSNIRTVNYIRTAEKDIDFQYNY